MSRSFCNFANYYTHVSMADTYPVPGRVNEPDGVLHTVQLYGHRPVPSWKIKNHSISGYLSQDKHKPYPDSLNP